MAGLVGALRKRGRYSMRTTEKQKVPRAAQPRQRPSGGIEAQQGLKAVLQDKRARAESNQRAQSFVEKANALRKRRRTSAGGRY